MEPLASAPEKTIAKDRMSKQDQVAWAITIVGVAVVIAYFVLWANTSLNRDRLRTEIQVRAICSSQATWEETKQKMKELGAGINEQIPFRPRITLPSGGGHFQVYVHPRTNKIQGCVKLRE